MIEQSVRMRIAVIPHRRVCDSACSEGKRTSKVPLRRRDATCTSILKFAKGRMPAAVFASWGRSCRVRPLQGSYIFVLAPAQDNWARRGRVELRSH
jgi:hypothetical protein